MHTALQQQDPLKAESGRDRSPYEPVRPSALFTPPSAASPLTPREREVAALIADGRSNQQIAEALILSVRTVERHIENIYAKLGVSGRTARVAAAVHALSNGLR